MIIPWSSSPFAVIASSYLLLCSLVLGGTIGTVVGGDNNDEELSSNLFAPCKEIQVLSAPSSFPKPTHLFNDPSRTIEPIIEPTFGKHQPKNDVILVYAEGYELKTYMIFIETLEATGFNGDVVLALADRSLVQDQVEEYLRQYTIEDNNDIKIKKKQSKLNLVLYMHELSCYQEDGVLPSRRQYGRSGNPNGFQLCSLDDVYGWRGTSSGNNSNNITRPAKDVREGRVVATLRYEMYWIWSLQYNPHSWVMLVDARDTIFQSNPFANLPRSSTETNNDEIDNGWLYFFGENHDATRIGKSKSNSNWIRKTYGEQVLKSMKDKPTICSGSTMGEQIAIETYLRALINEWDETDVRLMGTDQGFHNYLYYSGKLRNAQSIKGIIVWEQGKGIINNLGAMRIKPLSEWGIYNTKNNHVYQWGGNGNNTALSPVAHQYDRDKALNQYYNKRMRQLKQSWTSSQSAA